MQHTRALEQGGQVGVHVSGVPTPSRDLLSGGAQFAERLAVVGTIGQHDEHVEPEVEREMFGFAQREAGREEALDGGVASPVQIEDTAGHDLAALEPIHEAAGFPLGNADGHEDDRERLVLRGSSARHHPGREFESWQAGAGKDREFLAPNQRVHPVNGRDAGFDHVARLSSTDRVDRCRPHRPPRGADRRRQPVERRAGPAQHPAEQFPTDRGPRHLAGQGDAHGGRGQPDHVLEDLDHDPVPPDLDDLAPALTPIGRLQADPLAERGAMGPRHLDQGTGRRSGARVGSRCAAHPVPPPARTAAARAVATCSGVGSATERIDTIARRAAPASTAPRPRPAAMAASPARWKP